MNQLDLTGLKAHNPLGFLAACGLLRCLNHTAEGGLADRESEDFGSVKLGWRIDEGKERVAVIHSEPPIDVPAIAQKALHTAAKQRCSPAWSWSPKIDDKTKYCEASLAAVEKLLHKDTTRCDTDMFAAFASDLAVEKDKLRKTAFDLTSGPQRMLQILVDAAKGIEENTECQFEEALKGPWRYQDKDHSLGWDPQTQRLHALRWKAPTNDKENRSVRAAVFLGSLALSMFPCFTVASRLRTTGFDRDGKDEWFSWSIWKDPISLATLRSLLSHRFNGDLKQRGVDVVYRCRVAHTGGSQGNYQVFANPEERRWPPSADDQV